MTNNTIDNSIIRIGIDLGTTNSEIAICADESIEVVKNADGDQYTPSVVGVDKSGNYIVGKRPYERLFRYAYIEDRQNNVSEIKRLMGTNEKTSFSRSEETFAPEAISAEILKSLRNDALRKYPNISTVAAVITVPAYFDLLQNEATKRAGQLAGFDYVVLLQEPIAAAISYGYKAGDDANWLVYDLGGGTFDVALISSREGLLKVIEHGGDNFLGGKDIDKELVNQVLLPAVLEKYTIKNIDDGILTRLKFIAEQAKIRLTSYENINIEIDDVGEDDNGKDIYLSLNYSRKEFNELIKPLVDKTIEVANGVIERSKLPKRNISKVILVGGPTQIPYLRERVKNDLGIEIDTSVDPLTTVAQGACIYGLGCRIPDEILSEHHEVKNDKEVKITLNYDSMTSDDDETITGSVELSDDGDYYIKISSEGNKYTSPNIKVGKNGTFFETLPIKPNTTNKFWIYLIDDKGNNIPVFPDCFSITHGLTVQGAPIPHDVGVVCSRKSFDSDFQYTEECDKYFERNSILPLEATKSYKTIRILEKDADNPLPVKIYEGDSDNPDSNEVVTKLLIDGKKIPYNLPKGTDIDITIKINESRELVAEAYIPSIDLTTDVRVDMYAQDIDDSKLREQLELQKQRAAKINASSDDKTAIQSEIDAIEENVNSDDADSQQKASRDLKKLRERIDDIESSTEIEDIIKEYHKLVKEADEEVSKVYEKDTSAGERLGEQLAQIKDAGETAITQNDKAMLIRLNELLSALKIQAISQNPFFWLAMFDELESRNISAFANPSEAEYHLREGRQARNNGNLDELERHVRELLRLLPHDEQAGISESMSGITKS